MKRKTFRSMGILVCLSLFLSYLLCTFVIYNQFYQEMKSDVKQESTYVGTIIESMGPEYLVKFHKIGTSNRITLIEEDGTVLYDSETQASKLSNHADRPEVVEAMKNGTGESERLSETLGSQTFYYATKLENGKILRLACTTNSVFVAIKNSIPVMLVVIVFTLILLLFMAKWLIKRLITPLININLEEPLNNEVYEEVVPLLHRIDKQKKELIEQSRVQREQQGELVAITENMRESLIVLNNKAEVLSINKAALELFHIAKEECKEKHILTLNRNNEMIEVVKKALTGQSADTVLELQERYYKVLANPVCIDGELKGAILLILDITEKQKAEQMRKEFSANVSHELKTPLMSISGYAEIIKNGLVKKEDIPEFCERIYHEANRLAELVEDIIKLSKLDENHGMMEEEQVDLYELSERILQRLALPAEKNKVVGKVQGNHVTVYGVRQVLEEMVFNLCDNAIKYNKENGKVTVSVEEQEDTVKLSVADTGIGIAPEYRERVFERFYRVDKSHSRATGGSGLGLSIVKNGASLHNATVTMDSELGKGTTFSIEIPKRGKE